MPPIVTVGFMMDSLAVKSSLTVCPSCTSLLELKLLYIVTVSSVGATPSGPGSGLISVSSSPPPPQAVSVIEKTSARIAPK